MIIFLSVASLMLSISFFNKLYLLLLTLMHKLNDISLVGIGTTLYSTLFSCNTSTLKKLGAMQIPLDIAESLLLSQEH